MENEAKKKNVDSVNSVQWWVDFFNFKVMLIYDFTKFFYALGVIYIIYQGIKMMHFNFAMGIGTIFGGVIGLHIFFEIIVVAFSILDTLREIRNRLPEPTKVTEEKQS